MAEPAVIILLCCTVISGMSGVILNGGLIALTLSRKELRTDYCWLLIGMSVMNLLYCFNLAAVQTTAILMNVDPRTITCQTAGFLLVMCGIGSVLTQPLLALNRYSAIFYRNRHSKLFSRRNILMMISAVCVLAFMIALSYVFFGDYAKFNNLCCIDMVNMNIIHLLTFFMIPVGVAYGVSIFCGVRVSRFLKRHETETNKQDMRSAVKETKQIIKLIFFEIGIPICLETPILTLTILMRFVNVPDTLVSVACCVFVIHASSDPVVIMMIVKPYRLAFEKVRNKLRWKFVATALFMIKQPTIITPQTVC